MANKSNYFPRRSSHFKNYKVILSGRDSLAGLKSKKIAGVALDTLEKEVGILHKDCSNIGFEHPQLKELLNMENVMITSHQAFYTDQAVSDMVESALTCLNEYFLSGNSKNNLIK